MSMFLVNFCMEPVIVSTSTSINLAAYCISCRACVVIPVLFARVMSSSAPLPALMARPVNAVAAPSIGRVKPLVRAEPASDKLLPVFFRSLDIFFMLLSNSDKSAPTLTIRLLNTLLILTLPSHQVLYS